MDDIKELQDLNYEEAKQYIGGVVFVSDMTLKNSRKYLLIGKNVSSHCF
jgi:2-keto-4-pentenoate hydratase/2-oxohepta-3-ene-1,7-dioic acid hydratase in catechol pathway